MALRIAKLAYLLANGTKSALNERRLSHAR